MEKLNNVSILTISLCFRLEILVQCIAVSVIVVRETSVEAGLTCLSLQSPVANSLYIINSLITLRDGNYQAHTRGMVYDIYPDLEIKRMREI